MYNADRQFALQAAALQQHAAQANAAMQQQNRLGTAQIQQQGQALAERGQVTPAEQYQAHAQMAMQGNQLEQQQTLQAQRFQQQQDLLGQKQEAAPAMFTQGDSIQLQKLQAGMSDIDRRRGSGDLDDETADGLTQQVQPQIDALLKKQQMTRKRMRGQQTSEGIEDAGAAMATKLSGIQQIAKMMPNWDGKSLMGQMDPNDPSKGIWSINPKDGSTSVHFPHPPSAAAQGVNHPTGLTPHQFTQTLNDMSKMVDTRLQAEAGFDEQGKKKPPDLSTRRAAIEQDMRDAGLPANLQEYNAMGKGGTPATPQTPTEAKATEQTGLIPPMDDPQKEADAYEALYKGKQVPPHVKARLRVLDAKIDAQKGLVQQPGGGAAQPATRQPPEQSWGQWAAGMLPSGGNVGVSGGNPRYR